MRLFDYIERGKGKVIDLVSKMIEIPTVNPQGENYEKMVSFLEARCRKLGLKTRRLVTPEALLEKYGVKGGSKRVSLVSDWDLNAHKTLHITFHYDVVPATDKWRTPPFKAVRKGDRIFGRGAEDMKGNIASVLFAIEALEKCNIRPHINIQLSFTPDEEIGGRTGLGYLVSRNLLKADYAMTEGYAHDWVSIGNKGVLWAEVSVIGKATHASVPHRGVNSFERMLHLAGEFEKLKKKIAKRKTRYDMRDKSTKGPTFVMGGLLEGGVKVNVVPGKVKFSIDRRLIPEEDVSLAKNEIDSIVKKFNRRHRDSKVKVKFSAEEESSISIKDAGFYKVLSDSIGEVIGKKAKFSLLSGATDLRFFMRKGIPSLGYSARGGETWHSDNEFVYISSLLDTAKVYALVMGRMR